MSGRYLSEERFQRFEDKFDDFMEAQQRTQVAMESRLTALEVNQKHAGTIASWLSGIIATIVTAVLLGLAKLRGE